ncbi:single-strand binding protein family-domain-containing protein [Mycena belliarum]|uniref:Single-strand binding protein family-domain-containing protein n=1 Tax=Mycena belliarum TaxID=1033014 RepID=A0AAD6UDD9_9AGAR|nr:single-strand binding protein family-domain-containing protein [Mycena belliae]
MLNAIRTASASRAAVRAFSTTTRKQDLAKLTLIGNLGRDPELKTTKNEKEYVSYSVATTSFNPPNEEGQRSTSTTWHRVLSFLPGSNKYLQTLKAGSKVYVEAAYEIREPEADADPSTPQGQRQIFLKHESIRVISTPKNRDSEGEGEHMQ